MITVVVTFSIPSEVSASVLEEKFLETVPMYLETPDLVRKIFFMVVRRSKPEGVIRFRIRKTLNYGLMKQE